MRAGLARCFYLHHIFRYECLRPRLLPLTVSSVCESLTGADLHTPGSTTLWANFQAPSSSTAIPSDSPLQNIGLFHNFLLLSVQQRFWFNISSWYSSCIILQFMGCQFVTYVIHLLSVLCMIWAAHGLYITLIMTMQLFSHKNKFNTNKELITSWFRLTKINKIC